MGPLQPLIINQGFRSLEPPTMSTTTSRLDSQVATSSSSITRQSQLLMPPQPSNFQTHSTSSLNVGPSSSTATQLSRKRAADSIENSVPTKKRKGPRHCMRCGSVECPGRKARSSCQNPCQDCGAYGCRGRNSGKPLKPCYDPEAWT